MKKLPWITIVGALVAIGLFIEAGQLYRDSINTRNRYDWMPLRFPLPVTTGEIESPQFTAQKGVYYVFEIEPNGAILQNRNLRQDFDISWKVVEEGRIVERGESKDSAGVDGGNPVIGHFRPDHDGHFRFLANLRKIGTTSGASPQIIAVIDIGQRADIVDGAGFLELAAGVCGFLGLMALAFVITGIIVKQRKLGEGSRFKGVVKVQ
jgi:hypothetical protein